MAVNTINVMPDGRVVFLWSDEMYALCMQGEARIARASHVEPYTVPGSPWPLWRVDLAPVGGGMMEAFDTREKALEAEAQFFETPAGAELLARAAAGLCEGVAA